MSDLPLLRSAPSSAAALAPALRACSRHPDVEGARFCVACGGALCTACARSSQHKTCPGCRQEAGLAPHVADVAWYGALVVDSCVHTWPAVARRALPLVAGLLVSTVTAVAVAVHLFVDPEPKDDAQAAVIGGACVAVFGVWMLITSLQPALALPTLRPVSFAARLGRAGLVSLCSSLLAGLAVLVACSPGLLLLPVDTDAAAGVAALGGTLGWGLLCLLGPALLFPAQASLVFERRGVRAALKAPLRAGVPTLLLLVAVHMVLGLATYSVVAPLMLVGVLPFFLDPIVGFIGLTAFGVVAVSFVLFLQAVYAVAGLRYVDDVARAKAGRTRT